MWILSFALLLMKSISDSGGYVSFGLPEFENSQKASGVLKRFVNRLTKSTLLHTKDAKSKFRSTEVPQISAGSVSLL